MVFSDISDLDSVAKAISTQRLQRIISITVAVSSFGLAILFAALEAWLLVLAVTLLFSATSVGAATRHRNIKALQLNPLISQALELPKLKIALINRALEIADAANQLRDNFDKLDEMVARVMSEKGQLLLEASPIQGVDLRIWDRWISTTQAVDGSLEGAVATFVDNTGKFSTVDGAVTKSRSTGSFAGNAHAFNNNTNLQSTSFGSTNNYSKAVTTNFVSTHNSGSATVHVIGKNISAFITFDDPHFGAGVANIINQLGASYKDWPALQSSTLAEVASLKDDGREAFQSIQQQVAELEKDCPNSNDLLWRVNSLLKESKLGLSVSSGSD